MEIVKKIYESRTAGFWIIFFTYAIALGIAIYTFQWINPAIHLLWRLFWADFAATVFVWFIGMLFNNASVYDPYWSVAPPLLFTLLAIQWGSFNLSSILLLFAVWVWAIRLTLNWAYTFKNLGIQDWRYDMYKNRFPMIWQLVNFTGINLMPTIIVFLAMIPGVYLLQLNSAVNLFTWMSFLICIGASLLQLISDTQIHRFRRQHTGEVCNIGLWKISRHPNYLGEILMWWGVYGILVSVTGTEFLWTGAGALANTLLFMFISIPMMEKRQLANKPVYAEYQRKTGMLIPKSFYFASFLSSDTSNRQS